MGDEVWYAMCCGLILVAVGLIIFFIFYLVGGRRTKNNDAWKQAATELGLDFTPVTRMLGKYRMSGVIGKQLSCSVWAHTEQHGQSSITYMNYDVKFFPPVNLVSVSNSPHFQSKFAEVRNVLKNLEVSGDSIKATRVRGFIRKSEILVQNVKLLIQLAELIIPNEET